jgi:transcriptional regulator with XRE-family HTH domain
MCWNHQYLAIHNTENRYRIYRTALDNRRLIVEEIPNNERTYKYSVSENASEGRHRETFGTFIRQERQRHNLTLQKFAELVGVAPSYISNIESSTITPPSEEVICRMAHVLGLREGTLLARAGRLKADTLRWFWRQPLAVDLLGAASGLTTSDALTYIRVAFPELASDEVGRTE